ncbi:MAG: hypothetical protein RR317_02130 [Bilophila sp.]
MSVIKLYLLLFCLLLPTSAAALSPESNLPTAQEQATKPPATSGALALVTALQGQLRELKLRVSIEEQVAKLHKLTQPEPTLQQLPPLPQLSNLSDKTVPPEQRGTRVVSVQGVNGDLSAVIRTGSKLVTVRPGARVAGGVVSAISRSGVLLRKNGTIEPLPFDN